MKFFNFRLYDGTLPKSHINVENIEQVEDYFEARRKL